MPFFPNGCRALLDGWRSGKFLSWHTAQPSTSGSNAYTANGARRSARTAAGAQSLDRGHRRVRRAGVPRISHLELLLWKVALVRREAGL